MSSTGCCLTILMPVVSVRARSRLRALAYLQHTGVRMLACTTGGPGRRADGAGQPLPLEVDCVTLLPWPCWGLLFPGPRLVGQATWPGRAQCQVFHCNAAWQGAPPRPGPGRAPVHPCQGVRIPGAGATAEQINCQAVSVLEHAPPLLPVQAEDRLLTALDHSALAGQQRGDLPQEGHGLAHALLSGGSCAWDPDAGAPARPCAAWCASRARLS